MNELTETRGQVVPFVVDANGNGTSVQNVIVPTGVSQNAVSGNFISVTLGTRFTATTQFVTSTFGLFGKDAAVFRFSTMSGHE